MRENEAYAREAMNGLAYSAWLRSGLIPADLRDITDKIDAHAIEHKFNPNHDPTNGRFTDAPGGAAAIHGYTGMTGRGVGIIKPVSGGGVDRNGRRVPEQFRPDPYALTNPVSALAHYVGGSGEDRNYYFNNVDTSQVRLRDFPKLIDLADNAKPGLYPIDSATGNYNGDFTGLHDSSSWATVGGLKLRANGVLVIGKNGHYKFSGSLSAGTDPYDFNKRAGRSGPADALTAIGRLVPGKKFQIHLIGSKPFSAGGSR